MSPSDLVLMLEVCLNMRPCPAWPCLHCGTDLDLEPSKGQGPIIKFPHGANLKRSDDLIRHDI